MSTPARPAAVSAPQKPPTHLEPESERLAKLAAITISRPPEPVAPATLPIEPNPDPPVAAPRATRRSTAAVPSAVVAKPRLKAIVEVPRPAPEVPEQAAPTPPCGPPERSARDAGSACPPAFSASPWSTRAMPRRKLLLAARDRSAAERKACRSDIVHRPTLICARSAKRARSWSGRPKRRNSRSPSRPRRPGRPRPSPGPPSSCRRTVSCRPSGTSPCRSWPAWSRGRCRFR